MYDFMEFSLKNETIDFEGTKLDAIMPPISIFAGKARKKESLVEFNLKDLDKYLWQFGKYYFPKTYY